VHDLQLRVSTSTWPCRCSTSRTARTTAGPVADHPAAGRVDHEVDVALPHAGLGVGEALVLVRQRAQRLARQLPLPRQHAELAAPLLMTSPVTPTWSPRSTSDFQAASRSSPDAVEADHHLQLSLALLQRGEAELAAGAGEHDPPRDADGVAGRRVDGEVGVPLPDPRPGLVVRG
jgi:hypothetical protein